VAVELATRTRRSSARQKALSWPEVLRVLSGSETRETALRVYKTAGFTPDCFGRIRAAREAMADALTRAEDQLELAPPRHRGEREAIRAVRRQLEAELF
jgi:hypothetical protein